MDSANVSVQVLLHQLGQLLDPATNQEIGSKMRGFARPDAADQIAAVLLG
jgi:hypothetical protein